MKRVVIALTIALLFALTFLVMGLNKERQITKKNIAYDNLNKLLINFLDNQKLQALSIALALSKDRAIADAILRGDRARGYTILNSATSSFAEHLNSTNIYAQVYQKGLKVFASSWDSKILDTQAPSFRSDLKEIVVHRKPVTTVESSIPFGIKASVPIMRESHIVGILEITTLLDRVVAMLREYRIETIVLVEQETLQDDSFCKINPKLNGFQVVNSSYNRDFLNRLRSLSRAKFDKLIHAEYLKSDQHFFATFGIRNHTGKVVGYFITILSDEDFEIFAGKQKSLLKSIFTMESTTEDIYHLEASRSENIFTTLSVEQILRKNSLPDEKDYIYYNEAVHNTLQSLTKDQLINLVLKSYYTKDKSGEIR